jgi:hypothetical protein
MSENLGRRGTRRIIQGCQRRRIEADDYLGQSDWYHQIERECHTADFGQKREFSSQRTPEDLLELRWWCDKLLESALRSTYSNCCQLRSQVLRIEMQSAAKDSVKRHGEKLSMLETATRIFRQDGIRGFYRGITPRIALGMSVTTFLVAGGDFFSGVS